MSDRDPAETCDCACGKRGCASRRTTLRPTAEVKRQRGAKTRRRNDESQEWAENKGKEWTGPELEMVARTDLTEREVAVALKRTRQAVAHQRRLLRAADPTRVFLAGQSRSAPADLDSTAAASTQEAP